MTTGAIFDLEAVAANPDAAYFDNDWHAFVLRQIEDLTPGKPRLFIYYYYYPIGHAPNDFISGDAAQLAAYRKRFLTQDDKAAEVIDDVVGTIRRVDPGAIIMVFGDHGIKISRTVDWRAETRFWVQDNHAVLAAFLGENNACARPVAAPPFAGAGYTTLGRMLASVIHCLAQNGDDLTSIVRFVDKFDFAQYLLPASP